MLCAESIGYSCSWFFKPNESSQSHSLDRLRTRWIGINKRNFALKIWYKKKREFDYEAFVFSAKPNHTQRSCCLFIVLSVTLETRTLAHPNDCELHDSFKSVSLLDWTAFWCIMQQSGEPHACTGTHTYAYASTHAHTTTQTHDNSHRSCLSLSVGVHASRTLCLPRCTAVHVQ